MSKKTKNFLTLAIMLFVVALGLFIVFSIRSAIDGFWSDYHSCKGVDGYDPDAEGFVSASQLENDLEQNKDEYQKMVDLFKTKGGYYFIGMDYNEEEADYYIHYTTEDAIEKVDLTEADKEFILSFFVNRHSKEVEIRMEENGGITFTFFGRTLIVYENDEFSLRNRSCPV